MTADVHLERAFQYLADAEAGYRHREGLPNRGARDRALSRCGHLASMATAHFAAAAAMGLR